MAHFLLQTGRGSEGEEGAPERLQNHSYATVALIQVSVRLCVAPLQGHWTIVENTCISRVHWCPFTKVGVLHTFFTTQLSIFCG